MKSRFNDKKGRLEVLSGNQWREGVMAICQTCDKSFVTPKYWVEVVGWGKYCSKSCNARAWNKDRQKQNAIIKCKICKGAKLVPKSKKDRYKTCGKRLCQIRYKRKLALKRHAIGGFAKV